MFSDAAVLVTRSTKPAPTHAFAISGLTKDFFVRTGTFIRVNPVSVRTHFRCAGGISLQKISSATVKCPPAQLSATSCVPVLSNPLGLSSPPALGVRNHVADHLPIVVACHKLLGSVRYEIFEAVHAQIRQQFQGIRALYVHVCHVLGLVEKHTGLLPRTLLISPIGKFTRHHRVYIRPCL